MISDFSFILLKLLFIFFWRQINWFESRGEASFIQVTTCPDSAASPGVQVAVSEILKTINSTIGIVLFIILIALIFDLHEYFNWRLNIV